MSYYEQELLSRLDRKVNRLHEELNDKIDKITEENNKKIEEIKNDELKEITRRQNVNLAVFRLEEIAKKIYKTERTNLALLRSIAKKFRSNNSDILENDKIDELTKIIKELKDLINKNYKESLNSIPEDNNNNNNNNDKPVYYYDRIRTEKKIGSYVDKPPLNYE